jgi:hypothetical protein
MTTTTTTDVGKCRTISREQPLHRWGGNLDSRPTRQFSVVVVCLVASSWICGCDLSISPEPARSQQQVAAELEEERRLRSLGAVFSKDITRERLDRLLRPRVAGALVPHGERTATFRGLRFEFDEFGNLSRIRPEPDTILCCVPEATFQTN